MREELAVRISLTESRVQVGTSSFCTDTRVYFYCDNFNRSGFKIAVPNGKKEKKQQIFFANIISLNMFIHQLPIDV